MDHKYIETKELVERYLLGRLSDGEDEKFEEHFVDCVQCINQLVITRAFIRELRAALSEFQRTNG